MPIRKVNACSEYNSRAREMSSPRDAEIVEFQNAWNNYPAFRQLPTRNQRQLIALCEEGLFSHVREQYLKTHAELTWNQNFTDLYSSIGANILYNLDLKSSVNLEWSLGEVDMRRSLPYRVMAGYMALYVKITDSRTRALIRPMLIDIVLDPYYLSGMTGDQLNPDLNRPYLEALKERDSQVRQVSYSTMWECGECHARKTKDTTRQDRSLDECNTVIRECMACHKRWKPNV